MPHFDRPRRQPPERQSRTGKLTQQGGGGVFLAYTKPFQSRASLSRTVGFGAQQALHGGGEVAGRPGGGQTWRAPVQDGGQLGQRDNRLAERQGAQHSCAAAGVRIGKDHHPRGGQKG